MRAALLLAAVCVAMSLQAVASEKKETPKGECKLQVYASIDLVGGEKAGAAYGVPVSINGREALMTLALERPFSMFTVVAAKEFALKTKPLDSSVPKISYGAIPITHSVTVEGLKIGRVPFGKLEAPVYASGAEDVHRYRDIPVIGELGQDILGVVDFELNLAANKLTIFSQDHCPGQVVYWTKTFSQVPFKKDPTGAMYFPMELDGQAVEATLATVVPATALDTGISKAVFGFDETSDGVVKETAMADGISSFRAMALTAPGINIKNTKVLLFKSHTKCGHMATKFDKVKATGFSDCIGSFPLRLGLNVLKELRIFVSNKEKVLYFSRADATLE
jgi:hypothetical protein